MQMVVLLFTDTDCLPLQDEPLGMVDRFDDTNLPGDLWDDVTGAHLGIGCGVIGSGNSLYFNGDGPREARTVPLNTTNIRYNHILSTPLYVVNESIYFCTTFSMAYIVTFQIRISILTIKSEKNLPFYAKYSHSLYM